MHANVCMHHNGHTAKTAYLQQDVLSRLESLHEGSIIKHGKQAVCVNSPQSTKGKVHFQR
jgi:hypothetical protein